MKRTIAVATVCVVTLAGCQTMGDERQGARGGPQYATIAPFTRFMHTLITPVAIQFAASDPQNVSVWVEETHGTPYIVVGQEPVYIVQRADPGDDNYIFWKLPSGGVWFFPDDAHDKGIEFDSPPLSRQCQRFNSDKYTFVCTYKKTTKKKYPYVIKVVKADGDTPIKSDPSVMNN